MSCCVCACVFFFLYHFLYIVVCAAAGIELFCFPVPSLTVVMAFRAVSAPMLRSEPGTLLETVAGTMTMGTQNSSYFPRAVNNSSSDSKACRAEPRGFSVCTVGLVEWCYLPQGRGEKGVGVGVGLVVDKKWTVPRGGARSITTDSSETDRNNSTYTFHIYSYIKTHPYIHMKLIYLHTYITGKLKLVSSYMGVREMVGEKQVFSVSNKNKFHIFFYTLPINQKSYFNSSSIF